MFKLRLDNEEGDEYGLFSNIETAKKLIEDNVVYGVHRFFIILVTNYKDKVINPLEMFEYSETAIIEGVKFINGDVVWKEILA